MDEIINVNQKNELIEKDNNKLDLNNDDAFEIDITKSDSFGCAKIVGEVISTANSISALTNVINPETYYIIDMPVEIRKGLESGKYWLTKKKKGTLMAQVKHMVNGKKEILTNLDIKEDKMPSSQSLTDMTNVAYQQAMQQQLSQIQEKLDEIQVKVDEIEKGQKDDRIGEILGGKINLKTALAMKDETNRNQQLNNIAHDLFISTGKMQKIIKRKIGSFKKVPATDFAIYLHQVFISNYKTKIDREFEDICELVNYYIESQNLLVYVYKVLKEDKAIGEIYKTNMDFVQSIDFNNLKTINNLYPEKEESIEWYENPISFLEDKKQKFITATNIENKNLAVKMTGNQIMEVINNEKRKGQNE